MGCSGDGARAGVLGGRGAGEVAGFVGILQGRKGGGEAVGEVESRSGHYSEPSGSGRHGDSGTGAETEHGIAEAQVETIKYGFYGVTEA